MNDDLELPPVTMLCYHFAVSMRIAADDAGRAQAVELATLMAHKQAAKQGMRIIGPVVHRWVVPDDPMLHTWHVEVTATAVALEDITP